MTVYYFGCGQREAGHFLHDVSGRVLFDPPLGIPWWNSLDSGLQPAETRTWTTGVDRRLRPSGEAAQGEVQIHRAHGWSAFAWWDRSMDKRPGSCSVLLFDEEDIGWDRAMKLGKTAFPWVFSRIDFPIVPYFPSSLGVSEMSYFALWNRVHSWVEDGRLELDDSESEWFYTKQPKEVWSRLNEYLDPKRKGSP